MKKLLYFIILCPIVFYSQTQKGADIDGEAAEDESGSSVSLSADGTVVAIGAPENNGNGRESGHVRVYKDMGGTMGWIQVGSDIDGEAVDDESGRRISLSADGAVVAIGAGKNSDNGFRSGHVRVYRNMDVTKGWVQVGNDIDGEARDDGSGSVSLSSDGTVVAIGAAGNAGNNTASGIVNSGHVRVYKDMGVAMGWVQVGSDIDGEAVGDSSGSRVSLSANGSVVAIGAAGNDGNGIDSGHVRVYKDMGAPTGWIQVGNDIDGEAAYDESGLDVSLSDDGTVVAVGGFFNNGNGTNSGHVRIYKDMGGAMGWIQVGSDIDGEAADDQSGLSISLSADGTVVAIGGRLNDGNGANSGHVRVYKDMGISRGWVQVGSDIDGEGENDVSGGSVSLSADGTVVAIGARNNRGNGFGAGHVRVFDLSSALLSSDDFIIEEQVGIYPNPASNTIQITLNDGLELEQVVVYTLLGTFVTTTTSNLIDVSTLAKGIYLVEVTTVKGKFAKKIVVE